MTLSQDKKMLEIMKENSLHAYLATCEGDAPRVRPVSPIVEDDLSIWVTTFSSSRKASQIKKNPNISLAFVEQPRGDKAATVKGKARIVTDLDLKRRIWELAPFDLSEYFPLGPESPEFCLLKIEIERMEWRDSWTSRLRTFFPKK